MNFHLSIALTVLMVTLFHPLHSQDHGLKISDLSELPGCWNGTLTYLDYSTNKSFSMDAVLHIRQLDRQGYYLFSNSYPKEPEASSSDTIVVSADGKYIDRELIRSNKRTNDGTLVIITELQGKDGNDGKDALFRYTYLLSPGKYVQKKEVRFLDTDKWLKRHEYIYTRCKHD